MRWSPGWCRESGPVHRPLQSSAPVQRSSPAFLLSSVFSSFASTPVRQRLQVQPALQSSQRSSPASAPDCSAPVQLYYPFIQSSVVQSSAGSSPAPALVQRPFQSSDRSSLATSQLRLCTNNLELTPYCCRANTLLLHGADTLLSRRADAFLPCMELTPYCRAELTPYCLHGADTLSRLRVDTFICVHGADTLLSRGADTLLLCAELTPYCRAELTPYCRAQS